ncbi:hypothetical protein [Xenorhabdus bovienii]|uniref:hypothetical protein n=1 Tax=Xenorhabdus bovienii TaxID=40576 RepID=UPI0023B25937|nr:hypothetical protein [Xenorhabdus bovienii]MDE9484235.1 hypothetical protein [Xenorhabdus bovienii]
MSVKTIFSEPSNYLIHDRKMRPEFIERHAQVLEELKIRIRLEKEIIQLRKKTREARDKLLKAVDDLEIAQKKHNNLK